MMDPRPPETSRQILEAWFHYYHDLNFAEFYVDRRNMGKRAVKPPVIETHIAEPAISLAAKAATAASTIGTVPLATLAVIQESSLFEAIDRVEGDTLQIISESLGECTRCRLHKQRNKIVFGAGNPRAELVFVGEGPGHDEDIQGLPFVGRAGKLLTQMIEAMGLKREDVYICNVVKCRPPENRTPEPDEVETCSPFLFRQLDVIHPKVIVCLGAVAFQSLLGAKQSISRLRGQWLEFRGMPLLATYHPAYLLRNPSAKGD